MLLRNAGPRFLPLGETTVIRPDVRTDDGAVPTVSEASVNVYYGATLFASADLTELSPPEYEFEPAADDVPRDDVLFVWSFTIAGTTYTGMRETASLVRDVIYQPIDDDALLAERPSIANLLRSEIGSFRGWRDTAWFRILRHLKRKGKNPALILDSDSLYDLCVFSSLALFYRECANTMNSPRYLDDANYYDEKVKEEWAELLSMYDVGATGYIDPNAPKQSTEGTIWTNGPK